MVIFPLSLSLFGNKKNLSNSLMGFRWWRGAAYCNNKNEREKEGKRNHPDSGKKAVTLNHDLNYSSLSLSLRKLLVPVLFRLISLVLFRTCGRRWWRPPCAFKSPTYISIYTQFTVAAPTTRPREREEEEEERRSTWYLGPPSSSPSISKWFYKKGPHCVRRR